MIFSKIYEVTLLDNGNVITAQNPVNKTEIRKIKQASYLD